VPGTPSRPARAHHTAFRRGLWTLVALLIADVGFTLARDREDLRRALAGDFSSGSAALTSLLIHVGVVASVVGLSHSYDVVRRQLFLREQAIAAASTTSADWLWETDETGRLTYSSEGVRIIGYEPVDVVGRLAQDFLAPQAREEADSLLTRSTDGRAGWDPIELPWLHKDGRVIVLQGAAAPILDERGAVTGFRGTRRRLTDAMLNERDLAAAHQRVTSVLGEGDLTVALQPIVDFASGCVVGVEALTRFRDGRAPDIWFHEAVECGLALELDRMAFTSALATFRHIPPRCSLSINATPELLSDKGFQRRLLAPDIPTGRLILEITEHERVASYEDLAEALRPIRERGVRLAVDDTGAGYASLNHVLQLRPDIIKLDRSLVSHVTSDPARRALVTALVLLGLELGAAVTAEGVETPLELETLATLGVDHAQGYLLGRPTPEREDWLLWWDRKWWPSELPLDVP
jgi:PAS domain S-box-containing protein